MFIMSWQIQKTKLDAGNEGTLTRKLDPEVVAHAYYPSTWGVKVEVETCELIQG
jgi:hypothetical protein